MIFEHRRDEVVLDIGCGQAGVCPPETAALGKRRGHDPGPPPAMFDDRLQHPPRPAQRIADQLLGFSGPTGDEIDVILQIIADCRLVERYRDTVFGQMRGWANS